MKRRVCNNILVLLLCVFGPANASSSYCSVYPKDFVGLKTESGAVYAGCYVVGEGLVPFAVRINECSSVNFRGNKLYEKYFFLHGFLSTRLLPTCFYACAFAHFFPPENSERYLYILFRQLII